VILLIDIGNTRVKWATLDSTGVGAMQAQSYSHWDEVEMRTAMLDSISRPERVLVSNVGGRPIAELLATSLRTVWAIEAEFIRPVARVAGVQCGYANPEQLGADRWLGVIAGFHLQQGPVCVANLGTAMTVDCVDSAGRHLGGVIVPGVELAISSLLDNTSDIAARAQSGDAAGPMFANNTLGAVHQGVTHMLAATVERAVEEMRANTGENPSMLLSGGASERVAPLIRMPSRIVPDLVLQGLAVLSLI
jgi:type III pantothenate kinase